MKENKVYLYHISDCINHILSYTEGMDETAWKKMAGMRDKLIHDYIHVDLETIWNAIIKDVPALLIDLKEIHSKL